MPRKRPPEAPIVRAHDARNPLDAALDKALVLGKSMNRVHVKDQFWGRKKPAKRSTKQ